MNNEKRMIHSYEVVSSLKIGEKEVVLAMDEKNTDGEKYMTCFVERNELFQAKQYLLALQSNYKSQDDIPMIISDKLQHIAQLEQQTQQPTTELQEEAL